jgi:hypothetical protein
LAIFNPFDLGIKVTEISVKIGMEWKAMSEEQQKVWKTKAQTQKFEYDLQMYDYKRDKVGEDDDKKKSK